MTVKNHGLPAPRRAAAGLRTQLAAALVVAAAAWAPLSVHAAGNGPATFASPQQAVTRLMQAIRASDVTTLTTLLGPQSDRLVTSGDPVADRNARRRFAAAYAAAHRLVHDGPGRTVLIIGKHQWAFPIPIVQQSGAWHFDAAAGESRILARRIGRNELSAIAVCRGYVQAQREYAAKDRNGDGWLEYASRFRSSPGRHDGLYWPAGPHEPQSPLGPLVVAAQAEGYGQTQPPGHRSEAYHGYYYRILTRQGPGAPGGAYDYLVRGHMIGGFALVAFPARYGSSGVMTFLVNQDGVVYQKDLGPGTATIARRMEAFSPDDTWTAVR